MYKLKKIHSMLLCIAFFAAVSASAQQNNENLSMSQYGLKLANEASSPEERDYWLIVAEWDECYEKYPGEKDRLVSVIDKFKALAERSPDSIYSVRSIFNIGQIYEYPLGDYKAAEPYYERSYSLLKQNKTKWDSGMATSYAGHAGENYIRCKIRDGDTTQVLQLIEDVISNFPSADVIAMYIRTFANTCWEPRCNLNDLPKYVDKVLSIYQGKKKQDVFRDALYVFSDLAEREIIPLKKFETAVSDYLTSFNIQPEDEEYKKWKSRVEAVRNELIGPLMSRPQILRLPRE